jgi:hypothetical protein
MDERSTDGETPPGNVFYRIVEADPPDSSDFWSHLTKQRRPQRPLPAHLERLWDGISVYDSEHRARVQAARHPRLGRFIAQLRIPPGSPVRWEQTTSDPSHYTLWGDPIVIQSCVVEVTPAGTVDQE